MIERQKGGSTGSSKKSKSVSKDAQKPAKQRVNDVGRALRSVYDETLREQVPDDFRDLLGKLS